MDDGAAGQAQAQPGLGECFPIEVRARFDALPAGRRADIRRVNPPVFKSGVCHFIAEDAAGVPAVLPAHRDSRLESQRCRNKHR